MKLKSWPEMLMDVEPTKGPVPTNWPPVMTSGSACAAAGSRQRKSAASVILFLNGSVSKRGLGRWRPH